MVYLTFDFGGTFTKYAVINNAGRILYKAEKPAAKTYQDMKDDIVSIHDELNKQFGAFQGVGMSIPAVTDAEKGIVVSEGALKYVKNIALQKDVEELLGLETRIENDGNCAALAEAYTGAGAQYNDMVVVVCGTGIGGAILRNKHIEKGANLHAGEFGYFTLVMDPATGEPGTWSAHGSIGGLCERVSKKMNFDHVLTGQEVFDLAQTGDSIAKNEVDRYYQIMAMGIHSIQYSSDPEVILLGGGVSRRPDFVKNIEEKLARLYDHIGHAMVRPVLKCCAYYNDANLLGAYYNFKSRTK